MFIVAVLKSVSKEPKLSLESIQASFLEMKKNFKRGPSGVSSSAGGSVASPATAAVGVVEEVRTAPEEPKLVGTGQNKKRKVGEEKKERKETNPCLEVDEVAAEGARLVKEFVRGEDHEYLLEHAEGVATRLVGDLKMVLEDSMGVAHVVKSLKASLDESQNELGEARAALEIRNVLLEAEKECSVAATARADGLAKELDLCKQQMAGCSQLLIEKDELLQERDSLLEAKTREMAADALKWFIKGRVQTIQEWNERRDTWNVEEELAAFHSWYPGENMDAPVFDPQAEDEEEIVADSDEANVEKEDAEEEEARPVEKGPELHSPAKSATEAKAARADKGGADSATESTAKSAK